MKGRLRGYGYNEARFQLHEPPYTLCLKLESIVYRTHRHSASLSKEKLSGCCSSSQVLCFVASEMKPSTELRRFPSDRGRPAPLVRRYRCCIFVINRNELRCKIIFIII